MNYKIQRIAAGGDGLSETVSLDWWMPAVELRRITAEDGTVTEEVEQPLRLLVLVDQISVPKGATNDQILAAVETRRAVAVEHWATTNAKRATGEPIEASAGGDAGAADPRATIVGIDR